MLPDPMMKAPSIRTLLAGLPIALLLLVPASAAAADAYEASWNGGHLIATANTEFTEATIEDVSVSFDECGTATGETSCTWEAVATLHSGESRCDPSTPEDQIAWDSGLQSGNGTVSAGPKSFPLEGCRGQSLSMHLEFHKSYDETAGPFRITGGGESWSLFTFGYHPIEEIEQRIIDASTPATIPPPPTPSILTVAADCRSLTIGKVSYAFSFRRIGCRKATNLAKMRHISGKAPGGYHCRNVQANGGVLCWRAGHPEKYLEWRLPGTKPAHKPS
jgi:hypothetical protein